MQLEFYLDNYLGSKTTYMLWYNCVAYAHTNSIFPSRYKTCADTREKYNKV